MEIESEGHRIHRYENAPGTGQEGPGQSGGLFIKKALQDKRVQYAETDPVAENVGRGTARAGVAHEIRIRRAISNYVYILEDQLPPKAIVAETEEKSEIRAVIGGIRRLVERMIL